MDVPLHGVVDGLDIGGVASGDEWRQVMNKHGLYGMATASPCIGVAGAGQPVILVKRGGDQFEMGVVAMFGVAEDLGQRHVEPLDVDTGDSPRWPVLRRSKAARSTQPP